MKIRGIEVSKIAEIVIDHKYFWKKSENGIWERDIVVDDHIVAGEAKTQTMMVAHLNEKYFWNHKYKIWISPFQSHVGAYNTLNILKVPPAPPSKPNPNSRTQINKARCRTLSGDLREAMNEILAAFWGDAPEKEHECNCEKDDACRYNPNAPKVQVLPPKEE